MWWRLDCTDRARIGGTRNAAQDSVRGAERRLPAGSGARVRTCRNGGRPPRHGLRGRAAAPATACARWLIAAEGRCEVGCGLAGPVAPDRATRRLLEALKTCDKRLEPLADADVALSAAGWLGSTTGICAPHLMSCGLGNRPERSKTCSNFLGAQA